MPYISEVLASYIETLSFAVLPPEVVDKAKLVLLEWLGVTAAGSRSQEFKIVRDTIRLIGGFWEAVTGSTIVGDGSYFATICRVGKRGCGLCAGF